MGTPRQVAEAFSGHRFADAYDGLASDVQWVMPGGGSIDGNGAVMETCEGTLRDLANTTSAFSRFVIVDGGNVVAVDAIGRYVDESGAESSVSSCDIFEFRYGLVTKITSYTVELSTTD